MRRKFELLMKDLWRALERPGRDRLALESGVSGLSLFYPELIRDAGKVRQVLG